MAFDETTWDFKDDLVVDESNFCKWWRKVDDKFVKFLWIFCNSSVHKIYAKKFTHQKVFWSLFCFMLEGKIVFKQGVKFMNGMADCVKWLHAFFSSLVYVAIFFLSVDLRVNRLLICTITLYRTLFHLQDFYINGLII